MVQNNRPDTNEKGVSALEIICYSEDSQSGGVKHVRKTGLYRRGTQPHTYSRGGSEEIREGAEATENKAMIMNSTKLVSGTIVHFNK